MYNVKIRFHRELNFFLSKEFRDKMFFFEFMNRRSVKDLIESFTVPHVEVVVVVINGQSVDFSYMVQNGDCIEVYPDSTDVAVPEIKHLRGLFSGEMKFVCDGHLGKLARRLRLLGFDVNYENNRADDQLAEIAEKQDYILLSRDRHLFMRKGIKRGFFIRSTDPAIQIIDVIEDLNLKDKCVPFSRCISCNGLLKKMDLESECFKSHKNKIPDGVLKWCNEFHLCPFCEKVYWKGSHYNKLLTLVMKTLI